MTRYSARQKVVVLGMHMPYVSSHRQIDGLRLELFGCRRAPDPTRVLLARMFGNCLLLLGRAPWKQFPDAPRERLDVCRIQFLTTFGRAIPSQSPRLGVGQAFSLRSRERLFFDQYALPLIALARTAEANHHGPERRVAAGASCERGISASKKHQMIEIGARQAERPILLHAKETPLPEVLATLRAGRVTNDPENNNLVWLRGLPNSGNSAHDR
ncbi:MAG: hypothetical protein A3H97_06635 [Acidobacteria bacterium RIFCSPLOWO2_02_FULL_65_29]|nr:MAG: hypothetical protein A3H97_06635 [Acidobacteria bacterium RIFCSPLOWO2_02_FULL_65_29]